MLRQLRYPMIKFGLGYDAKKSSTSIPIKKKSSYANRRRQKEYKAKSSKLLEKDKEGEKKKEKGQLKHRESTSHQKKKKIFYSSHPIYDNVFYDYFFKCNQYGHKEARCKANIMHRDSVK